MNTHKNPFILLALSWALQFHPVVWRRDGTLRIARAAVAIGGPLAIAAILWAYVGKREVDGLSQIEQLSVQMINDLQMFLIATVFAACVLALRAAVGVAGAYLHGPDATGLQNEPDSTAAPRD